MTDERDLRLEELRAHFAARLKGVCDQWPREMFSEMVSRLAEVTLKYDASSSPSMYDRRATERLLSDMRNLADRSAAVRDSQDAPALPDRDDPA